ncbi:hypothetical protein DFP74_6687 [Nocardiopsis sp. Huas11]|uniref:hypothetical protein n=1 Tax=Nocardiopsis sp. Huas11 TaxID=2183912 RepID=UPI000F10427F|nr:hypothetical protein [Nocardiopsis sp. Huas11]RKR98966.1 hypothetical protein DFP74_6687 [Nocardiopsis sp. Huas11]
MRKFLCWKRKGPDDGHPWWLWKLLADIVRTLLALFRLLIWWLSGNGEGPGGIIR